MFFCTPTRFSRRAQLPPCLWKANASAVCSPLLFTFPPALPPATAFLSETGRSIRRAADPSDRAPDRVGSATVNTSAVFHVYFRSPITRLSIGRRGRGCHRARKRAGNGTGQDESGHQTGRCVKGAHGYPIRCLVRSQRCAGRC